MLALNSQRNRRLWAFPKKNIQVGLMVVERGTHSNDHVFRIIFPVIVAGTLSMLSAKLQITRPDATNCREHFFLHHLSYFYNLSYRPRGGGAKRAQNGVLLDNNPDKKIKYYDKKPYLIQRTRRRFAIGLFRDLYGTV